MVFKTFLVLALASMASASDSTQWAIEGEMATLKCPFEGKCRGWSFNDNNYE